MTTLIIKLPADTQVANLDPTVQQWIAQHGAQWPESAGRLPGTKEVMGEHLILADLSASLEEIEAAIAAFALPWTVLGAKNSGWRDDGQGNQVPDMIRSPASADILPFLNDEPVYDADGNLTGWQAPASVGKLANVAGHSDWVVA